jgi:hypothetical protein
MRGIIWVPIVHGGGAAPFLCTWATTVNGKLTDVRLRCASCEAALAALDRPSDPGKGPTCGLSCPACQGGGWVAISSLAKRSLLEFLGAAIVRRDFIEAA